MSYRIGLGTDFHQLVTGRKLWLGGIEIPHHKGALGHSDADVLLHAICDALLGALSLGDIGIHFPDSDNNFKGVDSKILLKKTFQLIRQKGFRIVNLDTVVCLEKPKIMAFVPDMRLVMAEILEMDFAGTIPQPSQQRQPHSPHLIGDMQSDAFGQPGLLPLQPGLDLGQQVLFLNQVAPSRAEPSGNPRPALSGERAG